MPMRDRVGGASLHAIAAKDTSIIVDVINLGVAFGARNSFLLGVFSGFYVDAVSRAGRGAQETSHAFFKPIFVALQHVHATKTLLKHCALRWWIERTDWDQVGDQPSA